MRAPKRASRLRRVVACGALCSALLIVGPAPSADAGLVGGLLGLVTGLVGINPFGLGRDEFTASGTPVTLGQVRASIQADALGRQGFDGSGVGVALIDTGAVPVPGLDAAGAVVNGPDLSFDRQSGLPIGLDGYGHGTHMAGIIVGRGDASSAGVAPGAHLVNLKVGASNGAVDVSQVIAAIDWTVQHRNDPGLDIRVLNLSYGTDSVQSYQVDPLAHAVESAWRNGIVVVVAAGNSGASLANPAIDPFVLTVGAADLKDPGTRADDVVASFSSIGTTVRRVDLVAPGTTVISLRDPGSTIDKAHADARVGTTGFKGSGTSQAAAVTSGAVAALLQARPNLTPDQVKSVLRTSARVLTKSPLTSQGAGLIDLGAALAAVPLPAVPVAPAGSGLGSLEAARGTAHVSLDGKNLSGEIDVQSAPWVPATWAPRSSAGTAWTAGTWNGSIWAGDGWLTGTSDWTGRTWRDAAWTGRTWRGDAWTGRTWRGDTWTGRTWRST